MGSYTLLKNQPLSLVLPDDFMDQGWVVSQGIATHDGCNPGEISYVLNLSSNTEWAFRYEILSITSGSIKVIVDGVDGTEYTTSGIKEDIFTVNDANASIKFYATGKCSISVLQVYPPDAIVPGQTLGFGEDADRWITYFGYVPEFMNKFIDKFMCFKNGQLWEQNINPIRNNFFGEQFKSSITFYVNLEPGIVKTFSDIKVNSNKPWSAPLIKIFPTEGKSGGMVSRLKLGNFKNKQGQFFADFLRNMNDPRPQFATQLQALFNGAVLQGTVMEITIENTDTTEVRLISVDVRVSKQNYTY